MGLQVNGKTLDTDEEGYLANLSDWEPEVAQVMAEADECDLGDNHWEVINFLRSYYEEYQIAPAVRVLTKAIGKKLGKDKGNSRYLYQLYPYGPAKQYAGIVRKYGLRGGTLADLPKRTTAAACSRHWAIAERPARAAENPPPSDGADFWPSAVESRIDVGTCGFLHHCSERAAVSVSPALGFASGSLWAAPVRRALPSRHRIPGPS